MANQNEEAGASSLSRENAEKIKQKVESYWSLVNTPTGLAAILAIIAAIGGIVSQFTGRPSVAPGEALKVEVTNFPVIQFQQPPGLLVPPPAVLPAPKAEKIGIAVFTPLPPPQIVNDAAFWKQYTDKGHVVNFFTVGTADALAWKPYTEKAGAETCIVVVDAGKSSDNFLGAYPLDKNNAASNINRHIGRQP